MLVLAIGSSVSLCMGCSTAEKTANERIPQNRFEFETVQKLKPGKDSREAVKKMFGPPELRASLDGDEAWLYLEGQHRATRLSLIFEPVTGVLKSVNWFVREGDPESDLQQARARFQTVHLKIKAPKIRLSHVIPDEIYFVDESVGLQIEYERSSEKVRSITWNLPRQSALARDGAT